MTNSTETCPATGETCVFVKEAKILYTGNHDHVAPEIVMDDDALYVSAMRQHATLLEDKGDTTGPTGDRCPVHERPAGRRAVGHVVNDAFSRPHSI
ncbi:MAG: hypothetical protein JWN26_532 [Candidatus Saccharibacteria bacterium]|nr:hypothetical protein [Candidatus Saccharibacteria bacterium]